MTEWKGSDASRSTNTAIRSTLRKEECWCRKQILTELERGLGAESKHSLDKSWTETKPSRRKIPNANTQAQPALNWSWGTWPSGQAREHHDRGDIWLWLHKRSCQHGQSLTAEPKSLSPLYRRRTLIRNKEGVLPVASSRELQGGQVLAEPRTVVFATGLKGYVIKCACCQQEC